MDRGDAFNRAQSNEKNLLSMSNSSHIKVAAVVNLCLEIHSDAFLKNLLSPAIFKALLHVIIPQNDTSKNNKIFRTGNLVRMQILTLNHIKNQIFIILYSF